MKALVAYYSYSGVAKTAAERLAKVLDADCFEIEAKEPYTAEDVDYTVKTSRVWKEMTDLSCRPETVKKVANMVDYDTVFVGFPIWFGREPSVVDTFLEENDLTGKKVVPFCTCGGSPVTAANQRFETLLADKACVLKGERLQTNTTDEEMRAWILSL